MNEETAAFGFYHGATWMDLEGNMYVVPGFHEEWIHAHPDLAGDCRTVLDMVLKKGWVSIVVFSEGYIEICLNDITDPKTVALVHEYLERNGNRWANVLLMPMKIEGFIQLSRADFGSRADFALSLAKGMEKK